MSECETPKNLILLINKTDGDHLFSKSSQKCCSNDIVVQLFLLIGAVQFEMNKKLLSDISIYVFVSQFCRTLHGNWRKMFCQP